MRLCLDRILPPRRERPVNFKLPALQSAGDAAGAMAAIASAVASAEITASEAGELTKLVEAFVRALEASELDQRLRALEQWKTRGQESRGLNEYRLEIGCALFERYGWSPASQTSRVFLDNGVLRADKCG